MGDNDQSNLVERRVGSDRVCQEHSQRLAAIEQANVYVKESMNGVSVKLDLILAQVNKVAILEERNKNQQIDIDRAHSKVIKLEERHDRLSEEVLEFINTVKGMMRMAWVLWSILGSAVFVLALKIVFFAAQNGVTP